ncbi:dihydroorotate dehydrogenase electron transfer subunit [Butyrivibrio sp. MC2013]|uniref:dihydroorotate dehydrogenase electron transfer subunit n=1 Tax=Butyrivibrio sp. MC2013 TaxID=1280686 RepID=UPI000406A161|nr:dihydroorotate dehydrogenase electron transfer subunit [Butyrivibrio sp. MC2013]
MKKKISCRVLSQKMIAKNIYDLKVESELAKDAVPGQFAGIYTGDGSMLLPRPISICGADKEQGILRFVYRIQGKGTAFFSGLKEGDRLDILGPLGNGYPIEEAVGKRAVLIGGGIGVPPLLEMAKRLSELDADKAPSAIDIVMGYRDSETFLSDEFKKYGNLIIATDDGSVGVHGTVTDALKEKAVTDGVIYACGPMPMLRGLASYAGEHEMKAYISLEEHMACGVGACLGCIVKTREVDGHSHVKNARICTDGPVFDAEELDL